MINIWLDTNTVRRWHLGLDTAEAHKFFKYVQDFQVTTFLPEIVLRELVQAYVDEATECLKKQAHLKRLLANLDLPLERGQSAAPLTDLDAHYRKVLTHRCAEKSITVVPLGEVPLERLLDMAVKRLAPFQQKGERGFRDALIVFCMLAYAQEYGQGRVNLISADKVFKEESVVMLAAEYGVDLDVYESVDSFTEYLDTLLDKIIKHVRQEQAKRVRIFLLDHAEEIQRFIENNAEFQEGFLSGGSFLGAIRRVQKVVLKDITKVTTVPENSEEEGIATLLVTFEVPLAIELETDTPLWVPQEPKRYRVGQEVEQAEHFFQLPRRQLTTVDRSVVCEATAKEQLKDKGLSELQLKEVKSGSSLGDLLAQALQKGPPFPDAS